MLAGSSGTLEHVNATLVIFMEGCAWGFLGVCFGVMILFVCVLYKENVDPRNPFCLPSRKQDDPHVQDHCRSFPDDEPRERETGAVVPELHRCYTCKDSVVQNPVQLQVVHVPA